MAAGTAVDERQARCYYAALESSPDCSLDELTRSYRDLRQVWHPDRFQTNPRLRAKAEERTKLLNAGYDYVKVHHGQVLGESFGRGDGAAEGDMGELLRRLKAAHFKLSVARHRYNKAEERALQIEQDLEEAETELEQAEGRIDVLESELQHVRQLSCFWSEQAMTERSSREVLERDLAFAQQCPCRSRCLHGRLLAAVAAGVLLWLGWYSAVLLGSLIALLIALWRAKGASAAKPEVNN